MKFQVFQFFSLLSFVLYICQPISLQGELIAISSGTMSITYDGGVFADVNSSSGLTPGQDYMRFGRFWTPAETVNAGPNYTPRQPAAFRPLPITIGSTGNPRQPNFRDNRATLDPLFPQISATNVLGVNGSGPIANSAGRNRISTDLSFDTTDVLGTMSGMVQTNGVSAWWFANNDHINQGVAWVSWGDLSLRFDSSRISLGYSGWVFANQLGGIGDIFDTKNVTLTASSFGIQVSGELWGSDGSSLDPYNENPATWETYTLMRPNLKLGSFSFSGTAVPEPNALLLVGTALLGVIMRRRR